MSDKIASSHCTNHHEDDILDFSDDVDLIGISISASEASNGATVTTVTSSSVEDPSSARLLPTEQSQSGSIDEEEYDDEEEEEEEYDNDQDDDEGRAVLDANRVVATSTTEEDGCFLALEATTTTSSVAATTTVATTSVTAAKIKNKKWKKPTDKPKRPLSAYNIFFQLERDRIVGGEPERLFTTTDVAKVRVVPVDKMPKRKDRISHGKIAFADLARQIGQKWKQLSSDNKTIFEDRAKIEKARYENEVNQWSLAKKIGKLQQDNPSFVSSIAALSSSFATANANAANNAAATATMQATAASRMHKHSNHRAANINDIMAAVDDAQNAISFTSRRRQKQQQLQLQHHQQQQQDEQQRQDMMMSYMMHGGHLQRKHHSSMNDLTSSASLLSNLGEGSQVPIREIVFPNNDTTAFATGTSTEGNEELLWERSSAEGGSHAFDNGAMNHQWMTDSGEEAVDDIDQYEYEQMFPQQLEGDFNANGNFNDDVIAAAEDYIMNANQFDTALQYAANALDPITADTVQSMNGNDVAGLSSNGMHAYNSAMSSYHLAKIALRARRRVSFDGTDTGGTSSLFASQHDQEIQLLQHQRHQMRRSMSVNLGGRPAGSGPGGAVVTPRRGSELSTSQQAAMLRHSISTTSLPDMYQRRRRRALLINARKQAVAARQLRQYNRLMQHQLSSSSLPNFSTNENEIGADVDDEHDGHDDDEVDLDINIGSSHQGDDMYQQSHQHQQTLPQVTSSSSTTYFHEDNVMFDEGVDDQDDNNAQQASMHHFSTSRGGY
jgi:HMG (high mobility group) box